MKLSLGAITAKMVMKSIAVAGVAALPFGLTWWAVCGALIGSTASLFFDSELRGENLLRILSGIAALGFFAALLAHALPHIPGFAWSDDVLIEVRAGLIGGVVNPIFQVGRRIILAWKKTGSG